MQELVDVQRGRSVDGRCVENYRYLRGDIYRCEQLPIHRCETGRASKYLDSNLVTGITTCMYISSHFYNLDYTPEPFIYNLKND